MLHPAYCQNGERGLRDTCGGAYSRRLDHLGYNRQIIQTFLNKKADDTV